MSGDMNTGLGNCLLMCVAVYSFMHETGVRYELANNGDDCVLIIPRQHLHLLDRLPAYFKALGFPVAVEAPVYELEKVDFCQTHPVETELGWQMVRDPRACLDKDLQSLKPCRNVTEWNTLRNTIGLSGLALAGNMPIFREFYSFMRRGAGTRVDQDRTMTGFRMLARGMNMSRVPIDDTARVSFFRAFDITPSEQIEVEASFARLDPTFKVPACREVLELSAEARAMGSGSS
jgi:hypothetical protein